MVFAFHDSEIGPRMLTRISKVPRLQKAEPAAEAVPFGNSGKNVQGCASAPPQWEAGQLSLIVRRLYLSRMNCNLPVYREAYKLFQGTPDKIWSPLWLLERYVNAAITQIDRIRETTDQTSEYHGTWLLDQILVDIHFYFICWDKAQILLKRLAEVHDDPNLRNLWPKFERDCKPFNDARNHLEHIDERLTRNPPQTGSVQGDMFVFAGQKFDISEASLKLLTDMYEEAIRTITMVDTSGKPFSPDEYAKLKWKPTIRKELPGRRHK